MKRFRVAVAGCGNMANTWVKYALSRQDIEIVALVDIDQNNAKAMAQRHGLKCAIYKDIACAIQDSDANLVFDITIPDAHRDIVTTSLKLGCDVFGEKPMASSREEAYEMVRVAKESGKTYSVMQNRRYLKNIRAFNELLSSNVIGKPGYICADFFLGPHFGGFRDFVMDSPLIMDMAIHTFDQARFIVDADPVSVYCHEFNPEGSWYKGNASAVCIFEFSNGSIFSYRGSWCAEGFPTSWESSWRVTGSKGTAIWDGHNMPICEVAIQDEDGRFINKYKRIDAIQSWEGREGHEGCLDEMFNALMESRRAETDCEDNIKSMAMVFGALESAKLGKKVLIDPKTI